jgi:hypothetical protein
VQQKISLLQQFLIKQLSLHKEDLIFEYRVERIISSKGKVAVKELEKKTVYSKNGKTEIDFTHIGMVPEIECYEVCEKGWNGHINTLEKFINEGKGLPE